MAELDGGEGFTVVFESLGSEPGVEVIDPIERRRRPLRTPSQVSPAPADTDAFPFPVDTAVEIETSSVALTTAEQVMVRDAEGQMVEVVDHGEARSFSDGSYTLEPSGVLKLYLRVDDGLEVRPDGHGTEIDFGAPTSVRVGCRSTHERPAATVTTTGDPSDVLAAISTFGSALKTTSPERSFASFRGHPPAVELGCELDVPDGLAPPTDPDDLRIEVPAEYRYAFPVAPLAYYLGVEVREGPEPRLVGDGLAYDLERNGRFEQTVEELLKHVFLLESVTRTEGLYRIDMHERTVLEERVDLAFDELYDVPQPERLAAYLEVPHGVLSDLLPDWRNAAHVDLDADTVEVLPYLLDDLALIRGADAEPVSPDVVSSGAVEGLLRGPGSTTRNASNPVGAADVSFVNPSTSSDALEETWVAEGTPIGATKAVREAYENRIGRTASTADIDISVVCTADAMAEERDVVDEVYGSRETLPFDVTVHRDVTTDELAGLLAEERDFLHYVGHITDEGFECADGHLDATSVQDVGVDAFFLNACQSYEQGMELIRNGAIGGIVTISDVVNFGAVRIGKAVARLLDSGFPLRQALEVARDESLMGSLYIVVGDGGLSIVQSESGTPILIDVSSAGDEYEVQVEMFGVENGMGGVCCTHLASDDRYYLGSSRSRRITVDADELQAFLQLGDSPIRLDGQLTWLEELDLGSF